MSPDRTVTVCRDCCCGSPTKHPGTDHDGQRETLAALASAEVRVQVSDCLGECERSNVVLVRDRRMPRRSRDTWLGDVHDPADLDALVGWVAGDGGLPERLQRLAFRPAPGPGPG